MVHSGLRRSILVHLGPPTVLWPFLNILLAVAEDDSAIARGPPANTRPFDFLNRKRQRLARKYFGGSCFCSSRSSLLGGVGQRGRMFFVSFGFFFWIYHAVEVPSPATMESEIPKPNRGLRCSVLRRATFEDARRCRYERSLFMEAVFRISTLKMQQFDILWNS